MDELIKAVDLIPWQVVALAGLVGFLVLVRYVHAQQRGELR